MGERSTEEKPLPTIWRVPDDHLSTAPKASSSAPPTTPDGCEKLSPYLRSVQHRQNLTALH